MVLEQNSVKNKKDIFVKMCEKKINKIKTQKAKQKKRKKNDNENKYKKHLKNSMISLRVTPKMKNSLQPHKISKTY